MNYPFELRPGATYILEYPDVLSEKVKRRFLDELHRAIRPLGCKFILLDGGMKIAREEHGESKEESTRESDESKYPTSYWFTEALKGLETNNEKRSV